jgi:hypothetical protein
MDSNTLTHEYTLLLQKAYTASSRKEALDCINRSTKIKEALEVAKQLEKR